MAGASNTHYSSDGALDQINNRLQQMLMGAISKELYIGDFMPFDMWQTLWNSMSIHTAEEYDTQSIRVAITTRSGVGAGGQVSRWQQKIDHWEDKTSLEWSIQAIVHEATPWVIMAMSYEISKVRAGL